jgi:hypothetical protein
MIAGASLGVHTERYREVAAVLDFPRSMRSATGRG